MESFIKAKILDDWKPITQAFQKTAGEWKVIDTINPKINNQYKKIQIHHHNWQYSNQTTLDGHRTNVYSCSCNDTDNMYSRLHSNSTNKAVQT